VDPKFTSITARFSPDGRWLLYTSNEAGASEISVRPFDPANGKAGDPVVLTSDGGRTPAWRRDGKEIFYLTNDGTVMAMEVTPGSTFRKGTAKALFRAPAEVVFWDAAPDGQRFMMPVPGD
jgi:Tol biopolymer transport system component